jgi:hypothetical protein
MKKSVVQKMLQKKVHLLQSKDPLVNIYSVYSMFRNKSENVRRGTVCQSSKRSLK